jgi:DNA-directed RNA polymerase specialized sigma24 family protein
MTKEGLDAFLASLDADRERAGEQYEQIRRKLLTFFRGRGVTNAEDAADETIDRVAKKLPEGEVIHNVKSFLLGVARKVASETLKKIKDVPLSDVKEPHGNPIDYDKEQETRRRERCVRDAFLLLDSEQRELIIEWYRCDEGEKLENRRRLAGP